MVNQRGVYHLWDKERSEGVEYQRTIRARLAFTNFPYANTLCDGVKITYCEIVPCEHDHECSKIVIKLSEANEEVARKVLDKIESDLPFNKNSSSTIRKLL